MNFQQENREDAVPDSQDCGNAAEDTEYFKWDSGQWTLARDAGQDAARTLDLKSGARQDAGRCRGCSISNRTVNGKLDGAEDAGSCRPCWTFGQDARQ